MLDFVTTVVGVSLAVLAVGLLAAGASVVICIATLVKNLPKGVRAVRDATESSLFALAMCGQSMAEQIWFERLQAFFGKYVLFGFCGIYVSVARFFALKGRRAAYHHTHTEHLVCAAECSRPLTAHGASVSAPAGFLKFSVVMKQ